MPTEGPKMPDRLRCEADPEVQPDHCAHWYLDEPCHTCGDNSPEGQEPPCSSEMEAAAAARGDQP